MSNTNNTHKKKKKTSYYFNRFIRMAFICVPNRFLIVRNDNVVMRQTRLFIVRDETVCV